MNRHSCLALLASLVASGAAHAATTEVGPTDDVEAAINALKPGDELVLRGGTYTLTDRFGIAVSGTAQAPIVVRAKDGEKPHFTRASANQNVVDLDDVNYFTLRGIEFSGGSHGIRIIKATFLTIEQCEIHDSGDVALSANSGGPYQSLKILRNHIHNTNDTGEGMYLGCNSNACRVFDSLIEGNHVHHTNGATVVQGDGIELKEGSYNNIIRDNVIHDTNYPCILTYSTVGNGKQNVIERNLMYNCGDHGIQSAADAIIRNNIILGSNSDGIACQQHQAGSPSNLVIVHNTVLHPMNNALSLSGVTGSVLIANNALYAQSGSAIRASGSLGQVMVLGNVGIGGVSGVTGGFTQGSLAADFVAANFSGMVPNDVFPKAGSKLIGAGDPAHVTADDFNGTPRGGVADVGAYKFLASGNPGWPLGPDFKGGVGGGAGTVGSGGSGGQAGGGQGGSGATGGGSGGAGATGVGGTAGSAGRAGGSPNPAAQPGSEQDGGCGCRFLRGGTPSESALLFSCLGLALGWVRRRRASR